MPQRSERKGLIFVLVGPTAVGKNTLMRRALERLDDVHQLPTATTRPIRPTEQEGEQHFFVDRLQFEQFIAENRLLEWQTHYGNLYGVLRDKLEEALARGEYLVADIEVLGASEVKKAYPDDAVLIFISPPDVATLEKRIRERGTDTEEQIARRFARTPFEMQFASICDYMVVNDEIETAVRDLIAIIRAEQNRRDLQQMTVIEALIYHDNHLLVSEASSDKHPIMPVLSTRPGEFPTDAICRLAAAIGASTLELDHSNKGVEIDAAAPDSFSLQNMTAQPLLTLTFSCEFAGDPRDLKPGWKWKPAEQVLKALAAR
jgi:guanylate kinase